jgi:hypothetical protein
MLNNYGTNVFKGIKFNIDDKGQKSSNDFRTLLQFIRKNNSLEQIEKELIINGINDLEKLNDYAQVVFRTVQQIKLWIVANGDLTIKQLAGL